MAVRKIMNSYDLRNRWSIVSAVTGFEFHFELHCHKSKSPSHIFFLHIQVASIDLHSRRLWRGIGWYLHGNHHESSDYMQPHEPAIKATTMAAIGSKSCTLPLLDPDQILLYSGSGADWLHIWCTH